MFEFDIFIQRPDGQLAHAGTRTVRHKPQQGDRLIVKTNDDDLDTYEVIRCELYGGEEGDDEGIFQFFDSESGRPDVIVVKLIEHEA
ncbi:MAG: hypothetical protein RIC16_05140 [Rhodospirillales bacterium]